MIFEKGENPVQPPKGLIHALLLDGNGGSSKLSWRDVCRWDAGQ